MVFSRFSLVTHTALAILTLLTCFTTICCPSSPTIPGAGVGRNLEQIIGKSGEAYPDITEGISETAAVPQLAVPVDVTDECVEAHQNLRTNRIFPHLSPMAADENCRKQAMKIVAELEMQSCEFNDWTNSMTSVFMGTERNATCEDAVESWFDDFHSLVDVVDEDKLLVELPTLIEGKNARDIAPDEEREVKRFFWEIYNFMHLINQAHTEITERVGCARTSSCEYVFIVCYYHSKIQTNHSTPTRLKLPISNEQWESIKLHLGLGVLIPGAEDGAETLEGRNGLRGAGGDNVASLKADPPDRLNHIEGRWESDTETSTSTPSNLATPSVSAGQTNAASSSSGTGSFGGHGSHLDFNEVSPGEETGDELNRSWETRNGKFGYSTQKGVADGVSNEPNDSKGMGYSLQKPTLLLVFCIVSAFFVNF